MKGRRRGERGGEGKGSGTGEKQRLRDQVKEVNWTRMIRGTMTM